MTHPHLYIGIMSGTSLDGIDVCLVETNTDQFKVVATYFLPYPQPLKAELLSLHIPSHNELEHTELMANQLAYLYADAVNTLLNTCHLRPAHIAAIGCHGQTIRHQPVINNAVGFTLQIGNAALLAELTNITVVADFRNRDIAAGGQGAPLVPAFHQAIFSHAEKSRAIINIGGIANITYLPKQDATTQKVLGFDSGPGNMLIDAWTKQHLQLDYDANGAWAETGVVLPDLLKALMCDAYFKLTPPKSTGRDLFNEDWLHQHLNGRHDAAEDVAHTLVAFTVHSLQQALVQFCPPVDEVYVCGGGAHNQLLMRELATAITPIPVQSTDHLNVGADWVEAAAFAWLAEQTFQRKPGNLPEVTGAKGLRVLGAIYPA